MQEVHHPIVKTVTSAFSDVSGGAVQLEGMTCGADMHLLVNEGIPPLFSLALTALRFCGSED